jgi:amylosucrase
MPDAYERNLREIFPDEHAGAFTFFSDLFSSPISNGNGGRARDGGGWVWTTFHSYQWDLNYANPAVFNRMAEEMLFLANRVEVIVSCRCLHLEGMGTGCENLPAHKLIKLSTLLHSASPVYLNQKPLCIRWRGKYTHQDE